MKRYGLAFLLLLIGWVTFLNVPATADSMRTFNSPFRPRRLLAKQFNGGTESLSTATDPTLGGTPLALTAATGRSGMDGTVTMTLMGGFTPPLVATVYYWNQDLVTPAKSGWVHIGSDATEYQRTFDATYVMRQFAIPEQTPFLITTDVAITGDVYLDAVANSSNNNTATGY